MCFGSYKQTTHVHAIILYCTHPRYHPAISPSCSCGNSENILNARAREKNLILYWGYFAGSLSLSFQ
ncbi:hypothetical protein JRQ81_003172 [Phrynocephalus forsythii]|uniref:Uncharacterized protein n=1 Tax=Phrynocephalus forsythii TaxID=171643 RepID=A0A9Q1AX66_9SAUR|nr:hypothetical protein JRQ81_003172 [Phrynocephalus forsythii]